MPVLNGEIKVSEPWSIRTRNKGKRSEPAQAAPQNTLSTRNKGAGVSAKKAPPERPIVDVVTRNRSVVGDRPFDDVGQNLSQKAEPKRRSRGSGGKTMDSFSQKPNQSMSRNSSVPSKTMGSQTPHIGSGVTKVRKYPAKGANAKGDNAG